MLSQSFACTPSPHFLFSTHSLLSLEGLFASSETSPALSSKRSRLHKRRKSAIDEHNRCRRKRQQHQLLLRRPRASQKPSTFSHTSSTHSGITHPLFDRLGLPMASPRNWYGSFWTIIHILTLLQGRASTSSNQEPVQDN